MQILVDADDHIDSSGELALRVEGLLESSLERFRDEVTRVEVHLSRLSRREAGGDRDMCCRMAAQAAGPRLIEVLYTGLTLTEAIHAAAAQLEDAVEAALSHPKGDLSLSREGGA